MAQNRSLKNDYISFLTLLLLFVKDHLAVLLLCGTAVILYLFAVCINFVGSETISSEKTEAGSRNPDAQEI